MSNASLPIIALKDLSTYVDKQPVPSIEGTLASLYEVETKNKTTGADLPYPKQNAVLKSADGTEHRISFAQEIALPLTMKGKKVRISSSIGQHGMTGLKMDRFNKNSKYHYVSITKSANIEEVGASTGQPTGSQVTPPTAVQYPKPGDYRPSQETHVEAEGEPMPTNEPMEDRIDAWLKTFGMVCDGLGREDKDAIIAGFTPDKIAEITTGLICSFKGKYATHAKPHFRPSRSQGPESAKQVDALIDRAVEATALGSAPLTWKDYIYKAIKLGDHSEEELVKMIAWAETSNSTSPEAVVLRKHLLVAKAEREAATDPSLQFHNHGDEGPDGDGIPFSRPHYLSVGGI